MSNLREMAKAADQTLYASYRRLSYLGHPRGALSCSLVEHENAVSRNVAPREFYRRRCEAALALMAQCLDLIRAAFERENLKWLRERGQAPSA